MKWIAHLIFLVLAILGAQSAAAQPVDEDATAQMTVLTPLSLVKIRDLEFGTIYMDVASTGGTVILDPTLPEGSELSVSGDLVAAYNGHTAKFGGAPARTKKIKIRIPKSDITVTRIGGTETLTVRDFTLDGPDQRTVPGGAPFDFRIGASVDIPPGTIDGQYEGNFTVTVQYP